MRPSSALHLTHRSNTSAAFLSVELDEKVPHEIKELFAVARGVLLYGWFFYPL